MEGRIGPYQLLRVLGRGGTGIVWLGRHELIGVERAIKVLRPDLAGDPEQVDRFLREARHLAAADEPHLVKVHEVGKLDDGGLYLAMDVVPGEDLGRVVRREGRFEPRRAARIVRDVALAVEVLHGHRVVHRDLKPGNVMLRPGDRPCLVDLGLARAFTDSGERLTRSGELMGTPVYMSPEQARGDRDVGPAADVWALGMILHTLVAGEPAVMAGGAIEVLERVIRGQVLSLREAAPDAPEALCRVRERACLPDPRHRYASARELAEALERFLATPPASDSAAVSSSSSIAMRAATLAGSPAVRALALLAAASMALLGGLLLTRAAARWRATPVAGEAEPEPPGPAPSEDLEGERAPADPDPELLLLAPRGSIELVGARDCAFDREGRLLAIAIEKGVTVFERKDGPEGTTWGTGDHARLPASGCAMAQDGAQALLIGPQGAARLPRGGEHAALPGSAGAEGGACGPDGRVAWSRESRVVVVDEAGREVEPHDLPAAVLACSLLDGGRLACFTADWQLRLLDAGGQIRSKPAWGPDLPQAWAFSPDGRHLAVVGSDRWSVVETDEPDRSWSGDLAPAGAVSACALSPGGVWLAVGDEEGLLLVDVERRGPPLRVGSERGKVDAAAFSGDGELLACGHPREVVVWRVRRPE